jgi:hypothetical protein
MQRFYYLHYVFIMIKQDGKSHFVQRIWKWYNNVNFLNTETITIINLRDNVLR